MLCGVRLQEHLQGVRVRLTLAVRDGDGYGSEEQEAGASHSNPEENITDGTQCVLVACSCRMNGERRKSEVPAADISLHPEMPVASTKFYLASSNQSSTAGRAPVSPQLSYLHAGPVASCPSW